MYLFNDKQGQQNTIKHITETIKSVTAKPHHRDLQSPEKQLNSVERVLVKCYLQLYFQRKGVLYPSRPKCAMWQLVIQTCISVWNVEWS